MREELTRTIRDIAVKMLKAEGFNEEPSFTVVIPDNVSHGDFATNIAMQLTKYLKKNPKIIAEDFARALEAHYNNSVSAVVAGPGFINVTLSKSVFHNTVLDILQNKEYFNNKSGKGKKALVEFVSANPTGPLHIGHGRGAAYGDSLARVLSMSGYVVSREYYVNDAGNQMNNLGLSVYARIMEKAGRYFEFPENGYHGDYIKEIADIVAKENPKILDMKESAALEICLREAIDIISDGIENDLKGFRVEFDKWFSEKTLYKSGAIEAVLKKLKKLGRTFEEGGALWLSTKEMGDDKDRVLKKSTGEYTYFAPDIAYHENKFGRGFDKLIDVWGADHHGYIKRMTCAIESLGYDPVNFEVSLIQMVNLIKGGEKISMSTRSGEFIPLSWLIEEVGVDAARFFYNMRSHDAQFDFDIDLAKSKNSDNPVYYIQYAHARVYSLLSNAEAKGHKYVSGKNVERLTLTEEISIIKQMMRFKDTIELAALHLEPHRIAYHLQDIAAAFHGYYYANQIITAEDEELTNARLTLCESVAKTIKCGLAVLGVSAPERM